MVEPAVSFLGGKYARTHHRSQGQRNESGDDHRAGDDNAEFSEQASGETTQEHHREENNDKGNGRCNNCKVNLSGPFAGGLHRRHSPFNFGINVFQNNDRIIHYDTDGQN